MTDKNSRKNNFILQAGILAAAGIISRIIGLLYRSPLNAVIGEEGMGYYQMAYQIYTMILLVSSYSIPSAISKVIAQKLAVREYRNAHRIFICSMWYVLAVGGAASLFLFLGAGLLVEGAAVPVLRVLAPTVFFSGILGVLRGYFQAHKSMAQTSVSQILEQIINAVISVGGAYLLIQAFLGTMEAGDAAFNTKHAMYGAMGSAAGTGAGVLTALLFMWGIYALNRRMIHSRIDHDRSREVESYRQISRTILLVVTPFVLSTALYNLSTPLDSSLYIRLSHSWKDVSLENAHYRFGIFSGQALTISNIPIAFASAMASAMIPSVAQLIASKDLEGAKRKIGMAIKTTMIVSIPCAAGLFALARPITSLLFPRSDEVVTLASGLLMALSLSVVFFALSTLNGNILQGMGKVNAPIINAGIALIIQTGALVPLLMFTELDLYALVIANTLYAGLMCLLNQISVRKALGYRQELLKTFFVPLLASAFMGGLAWAVYEGLHLLTRSNVLSLFPAILLGGCVYFVMLIGMRGLTEEEMKGLPKGYLLIRIAKKCKLMR